MKPYYLYCFLTDLVAMLLLDYDDYEQKMLFKNWIQIAFYKQMILVALKNINFVLLNVLQDIIQTCTYGYKFSIIYRCRYKSWKYQILLLWPSNSVATGDISSEEMLQ